MNFIYLTSVSLLLGYKITKSAPTLHEIIVLNGLKLAVLLFHPTILICYINFCIIWLISCKGCVATLTTQSDQPTGLNRIRIHFSAGSFFFLLMTQRRVLQNPIKSNSDRPCVSCPESQRFTTSQIIFRSPKLFSPLVIKRFQRSVPPYNHKGSSFFICTRLFVSAQFVGPIVSESANHACI